MASRNLTLALVGALLGAPALAQQGGDATRGEELYRDCSGCHQVGAGATNRVGPHLNHIFDRSAAKEEDFRYSASLQEVAEGGLTWDYETLDAFIASSSSSQA